MHALPRRVRTEQNEGIVHAAGEVRLVLSQHPEPALPNFEADQWLGFLAPRGTPPAVPERLAAEIGKVLAMEDVKATLAKSGMSAAAAGTPAEFAAYLKRDLAKWSGVVKSANIKPD